MVKNPTANVGDPRDEGSVSGSGKFPGEGNENPLQYFLPGKFHGQRSLVSYIIHVVSKNQIWLIYTCIYT